jgi:hypothetical protein
VLLAVKRLKKILTYKNTVRVKGNMTQSGAKNLGGSTKSFEELFPGIRTGNMCMPGNQHFCGIPTTVETTVLCSVFFLEWECLQWLSNDPSFYVACLRDWMTLLFSSCVFTLTRNTQRPEFE